MVFVSLHCSSKDWYRFRHIGWRRKDSGPGCGLGGFTQSRPEYPTFSSLVRSLLDRDRALDWGVARSWCQTTAGNASITNEFSVSLRNKKAPANRGQGNCGKLLRPPASEKPEQQPGKLLPSHLPLSPIIPKIPDVFPDPRPSFLHAPRSAESMGCQALPVMSSLLFFPHENHSFFLKDLLVLQRFYCPCTLWVRGPVLECSASQT